MDVKSLEDKLGITLFVRKKGVILTDEGNVLFSYKKKWIKSFFLWRKRFNKS